MSTRNGGRGGSIINMSSIAGIMAVIVLFSSSVTKLKSCCRCGRGEIKES